MAILILIVLTVLKAIYDRKSKKTNDGATTKVNKFLEVAQFLALIVVYCCIIGFIPNASVDSTYMQMQDKVSTTQAEIAQLEEDFTQKENTRENLQAFTTEYTYLKNELEEAESYIKENNGFIERGLPLIKFLIYFGK